MNHSTIACFYTWSLALVSLSGLPTAAAIQTTNATGPSISFRMHRLGSFRSEAICVGDFNRDTRLDVLAGPILYLMPEGEPVKIRTLSGSVDDQGKGYYDDFANLPLDVDRDGKLDLVTAGWFSKSVRWYRNTLGQEGEWPLAQELPNGNCEAAQLGDIDGDGRALEILPITLTTEWMEIGVLPTGQQGLIRHTVSKREMAFGGGVGDLNGDGRPDILRPEAWYQAPADPRHDEWIEHAWGRLALGAKNGQADHTAEILVYDVNQDGHNDVITSNAHKFGIFWYQQIVSKTQIQWRQHLIDDSWSQAHSLVLADLDGDGRPELITGKRFMAHNGSDPDAFGPLGVYYYQLQSPTAPVWTKHVISSHQGIGSAVNLCATDLDADGDIDIIVTGKWGGPVWFENQRK